MVVTLEKPLDCKGSLPSEILTKERRIRDHLVSLNRKQVIVAGCETDVCILQSCLGLLDLGYEVCLVEELLFSSSRSVDSAIARMQAEGAIFLTYKSLYYELIEAVARTDKLLDTLGPFPDNLPDSALQ